MFKNRNESNNLSNLSNLEQAVKNSKNEVLPDQERLQIALSKITLESKVTQPQDKTYKFGELAKRFVAVLESRTLAPLTAVVMLFVVIAISLYLIQKPSVYISNNKSENKHEPSKLTMLKSEASGGKKTHAPQLSRPVPVIRTAPRHVGRSI